MPTEEGKDTLAVVSRDHTSYTKEEPQLTYDRERNFAPDCLTDNADSFQPTKRLRQSVSTNSGSLEQLYRGEKARNQILQKKVSDLQTKMQEQRDQVAEAAALRNQNKAFKELILKYEER